MDPVGRRGGVWSRPLPIARGKQPGRPGMPPMQGRPVPGPIKGMPGRGMAPKGMLPPQAGPKQSVSPKDGYRPGPKPQPVSPRDGYRLNRPKPVAPRDGYRPKATAKPIAKPVAKPRTGRSVAMASPKPSPARPGVRTPKPVVVPDEPMPRRNAHRAE